MMPQRSRVLSCASAAFLLTLVSFHLSDVAWAVRRRYRSVTIEEYYQRAQPDEPYLFMPEARKGSYHLPVKGERYVFVDWNKLYFGGRVGEKLRSILRGYAEFDFNKFHELCTWRKRDFYKVEVYDEGFLQITPPTRAYTIVVPIPKDMALQLKKKL